MLVSRESNAATADADSTIIQLISLKSDAVPIVAMAVCAKVRKARIPAAFQNSTVMVLLLFKKYFG